MPVTKTPRLHLEEYKLKQDPQDYGIADDVWDLEKFKRQFKIVIVRYVRAIITQRNQLINQLFFFLFHYLEMRIWNSNLI